MRRTGLAALVAAFSILAIGIGARAESIEDMLKRRIEWIVERSTFEWRGGAATAADAHRAGDAAGAGRS